MELGYDKIEYIVERIAQRSTFSQRDIRSVADEVVKTFYPTAVINELKERIKFYGRLKLNNGIVVGHRGSELNNDFYTDDTRIAGLYESIDIIEDCYKQD